MYDENEDIENDFTNDNDILEEEEEINDNDVLEEESFKIITYNNVLENIEKRKKKSIPIMTKFEKARIKGLRLQQLAKNAPPLVDTTGLNSHKEIVEKELIERKLPFIIKRTLPNGIPEYWKMEEFEIV
jgi:DNA-directed RNA polymerase I, II, and III subunit RPABC2